MLPKIMTEICTRDMFPSHMYRTISAEIISYYSHVLTLMHAKTFNCSLLTLWGPLLPYGYSYKASCARPG